VGGITKEENLMSDGGAGSAGGVLMRKPQWAFIFANDGTWTYRSADGRVGGPFVSFAEASSDAAKHGFQPFGQYWTLDGRTTHYRPGEEILDLQSGETPPD
jgi:hypothetical protein